MSRHEYIDRNFRIHHTIEEEGPHPTIPYDHYDDSFSITIILDGDGTCYVEGTSYPLAPGTIMVVSHDEIRYYQLEQEGRHERITLYFSGSIIASLWGYDLPLLQGFIANPSEYGNWFTPDRYDTLLVNSILEEIRARILSDADMKGPRLHILILQLLFALYDARKDTPSCIRRDDQDQTISEICKYIQTHLNEDLSHQFFLDNFRVSRYHLTNKFQQQTGMSLTRYIITKRLMQTIALVRNGHRIEAAAYGAGFNSYCHFYKEFVKHFGISPSAYFSAKQREQN